MNTPAGHSQVPRVASGVCRFEVEPSWVSALGNLPLAVKGRGAPRLTGFPQKKGEELQGSPNFRVSSEFSGFLSAVSLFGTSKSENRAFQRNQ